jgi:acetolactate synthase-1/2/3 large subunit
MTTHLATSAPADITGAQALAKHFVARGVKYIYGVPGGDCSIDIIAAAEALGIKFILARSENSAAMMAAAAFQVNGSLGVVLTTRGPGVANGVNGVACAMLDRCGIVLISDGYDNEQAFVSHQRFDQQRVLEPVVKGSLRIDDTAALPALGPLLDLALARPAGPVYVEVTGRGMRGHVPAMSLPVYAAPGAKLAPHQASLIAAARERMKHAKRPVIIAGLQTRDRGAAEGLRVLAAKWQCQVFSTYMGKGALPDADPLMVGHFMAGGAEDETMQAADLFLMYGMDPIELLPKPWPYGGSIIDVTTYPFDRNHYSPVISLVGELAEAALQLAKGLPRSRWQAAAIKSLKAHMKKRASADAAGAITPTCLVQTACKLLPSNVRVAVDTGAHQLPVMAFVEAKAPYDVLVSRGLATMAYGLPCGIGAAMADPTRHVVVFTGDGGLMMCAAELATAAQAGCKLTVIVFNDSSVALIGVKQKQRGFRRVGMDYSPSDFAKVAEGFGCRSFRVKKRSDLAPVLKKALACKGTTVVDVIVDHSTYQEQIRSLRG